jgi:hypothetical protein
LQSHGTILAHAQTKCTYVHTQNIHYSSTRSHPSEGENRTRNRSKSCKCKRAFTLHGAHSCLCGLSNNRFRKVENNQGLSQPTVQPSFGRPSSNVDALLKRRLLDGLLSW